MDEIKKYKTLLLILTGLLLAKFVIVPVLAWQDNIILENKNIQKRLNKAKSLLSNNEQLVAQSNELNETVSNLEKAVFKATPEAEFKLAQQKKLESIVKKNNLKLMNFGWQIISTDEDLNIKRFQIQLSLNGNTTDIIRFMAELEALEQHVDFSDFNIAPKKRGGGALGKVRNARLVFGIYMVANQENKKAVV